jgi:hypothetical protein
MKKIFFFVFFVLTGFIALQSFKPMRIMKKDGAAPGYTGSPGDTLKNCTSCHGGTAVKVDGWITSNIPADGYISGETYTITTTNTEAEGTRFGFEISPQNIAGDLLGTMIISDSVQTKLTGNNKYITYTANGIEGIGLKTWKFKWIAPKPGTGEVVFYGGFNSNFNGHKEGDKTFLSILKVQESALKVNNISPRISSFKIYPNPSKDEVNIKFTLNKESDVTLDIVDFQGRIVSQIVNRKLSGTITKAINIDSLERGNYFVRLQINNTTEMQKITLIH